MDALLQAQLLTLQRRELTQHLICKRLLSRTPVGPNQQVLVRIAADERRHYDYWKGHTGQEVPPDRFAIWFFYLAARLLGTLFGLRLLERQEEQLERYYLNLEDTFPEVKQIRQDEEEHEQALLNLITEERLDYIGSVVLGLNDALVELTGALAGFTLALQNNRLIAIVGLITGIAASLSMAASQYLAIRSEGGVGTKNPLTASIYTGVAYIATVVLLVLPYFFIGNLYFSLAVALLNAILIILFAAFYMAVIQQTPFRRRFLEMAGISLGVAALTFCMGWAARTYLGVD